MMKRIGTTVLVCCGFLVLSGVANARESTVPVPFQGFDDKSEYAISYDDLSDLLRAVVVDVGRSNRKITEPAQDITGTRMKTKVKKFTSSEGNRFHYEAFSDNEAGRDYLLEMQKSLEALPSEQPLEDFSRDEQLAYWLNLYNVTVLNQIVAVYPKRTLRSLFRGKNSIFEQELLTVAGVSLSLNDIQFTILKQNYDDNPLIIYGLYQGIVGGPNIRTAAYFGDTVYHALEENAFEFVNSNRGTFDRGRRDGVFQVSRLYERNRAYFPAFDSDLSQHLLQFVEGDERTALLEASKLEPDIDDWTVTDLGGTRHLVGRSLAHNNAALLDSYKANRRNIDGSIRVASLEIKREKKEDDDPQDEESVSLDDLGIDVEGASVEEIATEETEPTE